MTLEWDKTMKHSEIIMSKSDVNEFKCLNEDQKYENTKPFPMHKACKNQSTNFHLNRILSVCHLTSHLFTSPQVQVHLPFGPQNDKGNMTCLTSRMRLPKVKKPHIMAKKKQHIQQEVRL